MNYDKQPRVFQLQRNEDLTGISGTGVVAWGMEFPDGHACMRWNTPTSSTTTYESIADVVHIHGHEGRTVLVWLDEVQ